jgi:hypothetical protein
VAAETPASAAPVALDPSHPFAPSGGGSAKLLDWR